MLSTVLAEIDRWIVGHAYAAALWLFLAGYCLGELAGAVTRIADRRRADRGHAGPRKEHRP